MAAKIGDGCINCGMCHQECPYGAIEEGGVDWLDENREIQEAISMDHYFVYPLQYLIALIIKTITTSQDIKKFIQREGQSILF